MNFKFVAGLAVSLLCLTAPGAFAAETNDVTTELKDSVSNIQNKLQSGKKTESELATDIKDFDALLARHKDEKTDAVAQILMMKAMLYLEIFKDSDKATELVQQLKRDFPETKQGKGADEMIESIKKQEEAMKIQRSLVEGAKFPEFEEKDLTGESLSIAKYKGKVVLVDFWATWCGPCVQELPNVIKAYEKYHPKGMEIIGISLDQDKGKLTNFIKEKNMTWQQFFDGKGWGNKLAAKYGIQSIPATFLLDGEGKILGKDLRGEALAQAVDKALTKN